MSILMRTIAILIEAMVLGGIIFSLMLAVKLMVFDLGVDTRYKRIVNVTLVIVGCIAATFVIVHLTKFYPGLPGE